MGSATDTGTSGRPQQGRQKLSTLIQIPTTAGTGSEAGIRALVTSSETGAKMAVESPFMRSDKVILDPTLTFSVPPAVTAATGIDALAHCVESFTNVNAHPVVDEYARLGIKLVGKYLKRAVQRGDDVEAREAMMMASYYGGICLGPVNTAAGHALAYPLSTELHLAHGLANAIIFPHVLAFNYDACPEKTREIAAALGFPPVASNEELFAAAYAYCRELGVDMLLRNHGAEQEQLEAMAKDAHAIRRLMDNNPKDLSVADILSIYNTAY
ncbi:MAG: iron-containing alcohol dehydrogenase [Thiolinea sp.]